MYMLNFAISIIGIFWGYKKSSKEIHQDSKVKGKNAMQLFRNIIAEDKFPWSNLMGAD